MGRQMRNSTLAAVCAVAALVTVLITGHDDDEGTPGDSPVSSVPVEYGTGTAALLQRLPVRAPDTGAHYDRDDWPTWEPVQGSCDTREWLARTTGKNVRVDTACEATSGSWVSPYDGQRTDDVGEFDADHIVPLHEAAMSGARNWSQDQRTRFANDRRNLVLVSAHSNRSKGDDDPGEWRPQHSYWCAYATRRVTVKAHYHLSVDRAERAALVAMLREC